MIKKRCPSCNCQMDWVDDQFYCYICEVAVKLDDNQGYCSKHGTNVDMDVFSLWQSVCICCIKSSFCPAYIKAIQYGQPRSVPPEHFETRFNRVD